MSVSWRFVQADWHAIMDDFRQKVHDTKNYDRIEYSKWKSLMAAASITIIYDKIKKEFYIQCYDEHGECITGHLFSVDATTKSGKKKFGDYLATYIVHIPEEETILATNYDTTTTYAATIVTSECNSNGSRIT